MNKHTPGPWSEEEGPDNTTSIIANVSPWVDSDTGNSSGIPEFDYPGSVVIASVPDWPVCKYEQEANARLIAAAPELLAACKALCELLDRCEIEIPVAALKVVSKAATAIANVEARQ
jgi:hypothetical protein